MYVIELNSCGVIMCIWFHNQLVDTLLAMLGVIHGVVA